MRTEANKMHKSIPLRKQETHSASLMTDLGLSGALLGRWHCGGRAGWGIPWKIPGGFPPGAAKFE